VIWRANLWTPEIESFSQVAQFRFHTNSIVAFYLIGLLDADRSKIYFIFETENQTLGSSKFDHGHILNLKSLNSDWPALLEGLSRTVGEIKQKD
jgi:hypothetical protein